ncbi:MAG: T9SS type A sorting domain-containing protein, partial [Calditrichaeota bacterium]|nr:T9SS type A sorting domain-containing protein [Calditrichota bacterium]
DGKMVGFGDFHDGTCGIAIWGAETGKFGLKSGDIFELRLWDANQEAESDLPISTIRTGSGLVYEVDGLSVIDVAITVTPPDNYFLSGAYPNPFNNRTTVKYGLPETGLVDMTIFDLSGRKMMELVNDEQSAGNHELDVNCTELTSGIYILSLKANRMNFTQKLVLVK